MVAADALEELRGFCPDAKVMQEAGLEYVLLPRLKLPAGCQPNVIDALLCLSARDGYPTRLFLAQAYAGRGATNNWQTFRILDQTWHCWSWKDVPSTLRPAQAVAEHLRALR